MSGLISNQQVPISCSALPKQGWGWWEKQAREAGCTCQGWGFLWQECMGASGTMSCPLNVCILSVFSGRGTRRKRWDFVADQKVVITGSNFIFFFWLSHMLPSLFCLCVIILFVSNPFCGATRNTSFGGIQRSPFICLSIVFSWSTPWSVSLD